LLGRQRVIARLTALVSFLRTRVPSPHTS
jgi:hypothetical protein